MQTMSNSKITPIICALVVIFTCIGIRLFYLQINLSSYFIMRGEKNFLRREVTRSTRGTIFDCNGLVMATNRPVISLYWMGSGNRSFTQAQKTLLHSLEYILDMNIIENNLFYKTLCVHERTEKRIKLATDISLDQLSQIEEQFPHNPNLILQTDFERYYPHGTSTSHVLGYLKRDLDYDLSGKMGLEMLLHDTLKCHEGRSIKTVNSVGKEIASIEEQKASSGENIATTIDLTLQKLCESVFPPDFSGTFILMDPLEGDIKALVSQPTFDPHIFLHPLSHDVWKNIQQKQPFLNRALNALYPPGSIFKLVTASAALEHNIIHENDQFTCRGFYLFAKRKYWCSQKWGHGTLSTRQAVAQSCNPFFFNIGKTIDIDVLADYAHRFGLGEPTSIILPEKIGTVPSRAWKKQTKGEKWWTGETLSTAIGQSFLQVTPLQVVRMIASIFTGYLVKPRILLSETIETRPLAIKPSTREFLKSAMRATVDEGTGQGVKTISDTQLELYAKTSTAQTSDLQKRALGNEYLEHGWFVGHFMYKDHRPLTFVILVEHAGSSRVPKKIAYNFLLKYKKLYA